MNAGERERERLTPLWVHGLALLPQHLIKDC